MTIRFDHLVLWTADPLAAVEFYERVVGLEGVRVAEFEAGKAPFPSVRISAETIIDLMRGDGAGPVDHLCLSMDHAEFTALRARLDDAGIPIRGSMTDSFGAQGLAPETIYFADPDGNVIEARHYG